ncbi:NAD-dependent deacetylase [Methanolobus chelungpuianus]|uniref:NAD-dependent deacetylase n=2 Tax=Methanolobus chelungpuianus TaxID=502115 RepID=A0AAE3L135_9EURY|nr:NAD-dependent deacetylase [Methanolobus chelungpuianus]
MDRFIELLEGSRHCVFLSGAGISTFSGIFDFRGKNGIYRRFDADRIFDIDHFHSSPEYFYSHSREMVFSVGEKEPNFIHNTLAKMETAGMIKTLITQNIDMLHWKAGSRNLIEIHGSARENTCLSCGKKYSYEHVAKVVNNGRVPECVSCGGLIKPDIVFFGEMLDEGTITKAMIESSLADLFVVIGSSLVVQPAASLPLCSIRNKGKLVIVNDMPTPLDEYAYLRYNDLEDVFRKLEKHFFRGQLQAEQKDESSIKEKL